MKTLKLNLIGFVTTAALVFTILNCGKSTKDPAAGGGRTGVGADLFPGRSRYHLVADSDEIKIVAYNVENLFDVLHDEGKEDYTFLPKGYPGKDEYCKSLTVPSYKRECEDTDWTQDKLDIKLGKLAQAISKQGPLPDILAVEEIENENVARQLARALGYSTTNLKISNGPDARGIDNAIFYKTDKIRPLPDVADIELNGPEFDGGPTRNILRKRFAIVNGPRDAVIEVFVNHWPSQSAGPPKRVAAARALKAAVEEETQRLGSNYYPIAVGDFNTLVNERPNAFDDVIENVADWPNAMWDAEKASYAAGNPLANEMPEHSYYYDRDHSWSKLDRILLGRNWGQGERAVGLTALIDSFRYVADPSLLEQRRDRNMGPSGFDATFRYKRTVQQQGYSDHLQVAMKLRVR